MRANIRTPEYLDECEYRATRGAAYTPRVFNCGDDFAAMNGTQRGDVAHCKHGRIWLISRHGRLFVRGVKLTPFWNPIKHRKARNALARSHDGEIEYGLAGRVWAKPYWNPRGGDQ